MTGFCITWCDRGEDCETTTTDLDEAMALYHDLEADSAVTWAQVDNTHYETIAAFDRTR